MGAAVDALSDSIDQTVRNPTLIVTAVVAAMVGGLIAGVLSLVPLIGQLLASPVIAVFLAGIIGMAYAGATDQTAASVSDYTNTLSEHGLTVFLASLVKNLVLGVFAVVLGVVFLVIPLFALGLGEAGTSQPGGSAPGAFGALLAGAGILFLLFFFLWLGVLLLAQMLFQFIDSAVVIGGKDVTGSLSESINLFTESPGSVVIFSLLRGGLFVGLLLVVGTLAFAGSQVSPDLGVVFAVLGVLVGYPTIGTAAFVYETRYYMHRRPDTTGGRDTPTRSQSPTARQPR